MGDPNKVTRGSTDSNFQIQAKSVLKERSEKPSMPKPPIEDVLAEEASKMFKFKEKDPEIREYLEQKAAMVLSQMWRAGRANGTDLQQFSKQIERASRKEIEAMREEIDSRSIPEIIMRSWKKYAAWSLFVVFVAIFFKLF